MSVKLSSLKKREIRRKIVFTDEMGVQEVITVKNPSEEEKETIVRFLGEKIDTAKEEFDIDPKDIMVNFLPLLNSDYISIIEDSNNLKSFLLKYLLVWDFFCNFASYIF